MVIRNTKMGTAIKPMSEANLNECTKAILKTNSVQQEEIIKIVLQKGWEAKGYDSFKQYCQGDLFDMNYDTLNRQRRIGLTVFNVAGMEAVGKYSGHAIEPLFNLEPKVQKQVWAELQKQHGDGNISKKWLTRTRVEKALKKLGLLKDKAAAHTSESDGHSKVSSPLKYEKEFFNNLKNENLDDKKFARRIAKCSSTIFSQKARLKMCQFMLKDVASEKLSEELEILLNEI